MGASQTADRLQWALIIVGVAGWIMLVAGLALPGTPLGMGPAGAGAGLLALGALAALIAGVGAAGWIWGARGARPPWRTLAFIAAAPPALQLGAAFLAANVPTGPTQAGVWPVWKTEVQERARRTRHLLHVYAPLDGAGHLAINTTRFRRQPGDFFAYRAGGCLRATWRRSLDGDLLLLSRAPAACPAGRGAPPPEGPVRLLTDGVHPSEWRWAYPSALRGPAMDAWQARLPDLLTRHAGDSTPTVLEVAARTDPDGRVTAIAVLRSSGAAALDRTVTESLRAPDLFAPLRDDAGQAVAGWQALPPLRFAFAGEVSPG